MPKLFELSGEKFMQGLSLQSSLAMGGLFQNALNFDPFAKFGIFKGSPVAVQKGSSVITSDIRAFVPFSDSKAKLLAMSNYAGSGKCAYLINITDDTYTDVTSAFHTETSPGTPVLTSDCIYYKGRLLYDSASQIRSVSTTPNDDQAVEFASTFGDFHPFHIGPDNYLYYGNQANVGKVVTANATTSNTGQALTFSNTSLTVKDLTDDGIYLVIVADTNDLNIAGLTSICKVMFWDMSKSYSDYVWNIPDTYIIGVEYLDNTVYVFGYNGIYVCSAGTRPKLLASFLGDTPLRRPGSHTQIVNNGHSIIWTDGGTTGRLFAYGNPIPGKPKIFYQPYQTPNLSVAAKALVCCGSTYFTSTASNNLYKLNDTATLGGAELITCPIVLPQPYTFTEAKVVLSDSLTSSQTTDLTLSTANGRTISALSSKTSITDPNKTELLFKPLPASDSVPYFNEFVLDLAAGAGAEVEKVEIYGEPQDPSTQRI